MDQMYYRRNSRKSYRTKSKKGGKGLGFYLIPFIGVLIVYLLSKLFGVVSDQFADLNGPNLENALLVESLTGSISYQYNDLAGSLNLLDPILPGYEVTVPFDSALVLSTQKGSTLRIDQSTSFAYVYDEDDSLNTLHFKLKTGRLWSNSKGIDENILISSDYLSIQSSDSVLSFKANLPENLNVFSGQSLVTLKDNQNGAELDKFRVESSSSLNLDNQSYQKFLVNQVAMIKSKTQSNVYLSNWYKWNTFYDNNNVSYSYEDLFADDSVLSFNNIKNQILKENGLIDEEEEDVIDKSTTPYFTFPKENEVITEYRIKMIGKVPLNTAKVMIVSYEGDELVRYILKEYEANTEDFVYYASFDPERGNLVPGINKFEVIAIDQNGVESPSSNVSFVFRDPANPTPTSSDLKEDSTVGLEEQEQVLDSGEQQVDKVVVEETTSEQGVDESLAPIELSTINDLPYVENFVLNKDRAYLVGFVPEGTNKVTVNGFDLTMFKPGATRFHYILSDGFKNLKVGLNTVNVQYEKDGKLSPVYTFTINYQQN